MPTATATEVVTSAIASPPSNFNRGTEQRIIAHAASNIREVMGLEVTRTRLLAQIALQFAEANNNWRAFQHACWLVRNAHLPV